MMQLKSVNNNIGIKLLFDVKQKESLLYSSEIQTAFEKNKDSHQNYIFVQERRSYVAARARLENALSENLTLDIGALEDILQQALYDLENALQTLDDSAAIILRIQNVSCIIFRIIAILKY
ncbi:MAG: hypothetical protein KME64_38220 [Scytonematopsis contorta HA4267-MV1]|jgi:hypothetical protein|nr:hypothetical protein [Scytonematopsis contorta HA4267-MV1]